MTEKPATGNVESFLIQNHNSLWKKIPFEMFPEICEAMEEYASLLSNDEAGFKWVKASERLPEKSGRYHIRFHSGRCKGEKQTSWFIPDDSIPWLWELNGDFIEEFRFIEWLDQSPSQPKEQPLTPDELNIAFLTWYSGMEDSKIRMAFERWKRDHLNNSK